ncbi:MAG TPA: 3-dehydroquinate synthase [Candidatus Sulfotelmatobacter sp.]|nr:3-dehydroquinate synthase [Candidatus Sulfotelmatobacter sp.]
MTTNAMYGDVRVRAASGDYFVRCQRGILRKAVLEIGRLGKFSGVHIVTSPRVWRALGKQAQHGLLAQKSTRLHLFNDAEAAKNLNTVEAIARKLVRGGADRKSLLIALGGGVVGDVVGFVAASYLRGVQFVQVPTTVVAQVDSAVGGKTGVNLPEGKNLVGAFYPPRLVLVDPEVLASLPAREFRGGLAEIIKYGVISDARLFAYLEQNIQSILAREPRAVEHVIRRSIEIKARIVSRDERESGLREILNYGHTFAHALEAATRYKKFQHGEAVAWGMMCAALLGHETIQTPPDDVARIIALVRQIGPLPAWPAVRAEKLFELMRADKKTKFGKVRFVLSPRLGRAQTYDGVTEKAAICVLRFGPHMLLRHADAFGTCHD